VPFSLDIWLAASVYSMECGLCGSPLAPQDGQELPPGSASKGRVLNCLHILCTGCLGDHIKAIPDRGKVVAICPLCSDITVKDLPSAYPGTPRTPGGADISRISSYDSDISISNLDTTPTQFRERVDTETIGDFYPDHDAIDLNLEFADLPDDILHCYQDNSTVAPTFEDIYVQNESVHDSSQLENDPDVSNLTERTRPRPANRSFISTDTTSTALTTPPENNEVAWLHIVLNCAVIVVCLLLLLLVGPEALSNNPYLQIHTTAAVRRGLGGLLVLHYMWQESPRSALTTERTWLVGRTDALAVLSLLALSIQGQAVSVCSALLQRLGRMLAGLHPHTRMWAILGVAVGTSVSLVVAGVYLLIAVQGTTAEETSTFEEVVEGDEGLASGREELLERQTPAVTRVQGRTTPAPIGVATTAPVTLAEAQQGANIKKQQQQPQKRSGIKHTGVNPLRRHSYSSVPDAARYRQETYLGGIAMKGNRSNTFAVPSESLRFDTKESAVDDADQQGGADLPMWADEALPGDDYDAASGPVPMEVPVVGSAAEYEHEEQAVAGVDETGRGENEDKYDSDEPVTEAATDSAVDSLTPAVDSSASAAPVDDPTREVKETTVGSAAPVTATEAADVDHEQEQQLELAIAHLTEQHLARTSPRRRYSSPSLTAVASTASAGPAAITPTGAPLSEGSLSSSKLLRRNSDMFVAGSHAESTPGDVWVGAPPSPAAETYTQRVFGGHKYSYPGSTEKSAPTSADSVKITGASFELRGWRPYAFRDVISRVMQLQTEHNKADHSGAPAAAAPPSTGSRSEETTRDHSGPQQLASNASFRELSPLRSSPAEAILATSLSPVPPPLLSHTSSSMMPTRMSPDSSGHGGTRPPSAGKERSSSRGGGSSSGVAVGVHAPEPRRMSVDARSMQSAAVAAAAIVAAAKSAVSVEQTAVPSGTPAPRTVPSPHDTREVLAAVTATTTTPSLVVSGMPAAASALPSAPTPPLAHAAVSAPTAEAVHASPPVSLARPLSRNRRSSFSGSPGALRPELSAGSVSPGLPPPMEAVISEAAAPVPATQLPAMSSRNSPSSSLAYSGSSVSAHARTVSPDGGLKRPRNTPNSSWEAAAHTHRGAPSDLGPFFNDSATVATGTTLGTADSTATPRRRKRVKAWRSMYAYSPGAAPRTPPAHQPHLASSLGPIGSPYGSHPHHLEVRSGGNRLESPQSVRAVRQMQSSAAEQSFASIRSGGKKTPTSANSSISSHSTGTGRKSRTSVPAPPSLDLSSVTMGSYATLYDRRRDSGAHTAPAGAGDALVGAAAVTEHVPAAPALSPVKVHADFSERRSWGPVPASSHADDPPSIGTRDARDSEAQTPATEQQYPQYHEVEGGYRSDTSSDTTYCSVPEEDLHPFDGNDVAAEGSAERLRIVRRLSMRQVSPAPQFTTPPSAGSLVAAQYRAFSASGASAEHDATSERQLVPTLSSPVAVPAATFAASPEVIVSELSIAYITPAAMGARPQLQELNESTDSDAGGGEDNQSHEGPATVGGGNPEPEREEQEGQAATAAAPPSPTCKAQGEGTRVGEAIRDDYHNLTCANAVSAAAHKEEVAPNDEVAEAVEPLSGAPSSINEEIDTGAEGSSAGQAHTDTGGSLDAPVPADENGVAPADRANPEGDDVAGVMETDANPADYTTPIIEDPGEDNRPDGIHSDDDVAAAGRSEDFPSPAQEAIAPDLPAAEEEMDGSPQDGWMLEGAVPMTLPPGPAVCPVDYSAELPVIGRPGEEQQTLQEQESAGYGESGEKLASAAAYEDRYDSDVSEDSLEPAQHAASADGGTATVEAVLERLGDQEAAIPSAVATALTSPVTDLAGRDTVTPEDVPNMSSPIQRPASAPAALDMTGEEEEVASEPAAVVADATAGALIEEPAPVITPGSAINSEERSAGLSDGDAPQDSISALDLSHIHPTHPDSNRLDQSAAQLDASIVLSSPVKGTEPAVLATEGNHSTPPGSHRAGVTSADPGVAASSNASPTGRTSRHSGSFNGATAPVDGTPEAAVSLSRLASMSGSKLPAGVYTPHATAVVAQPAFAHLPISPFNYVDRSLTSATSSNTSPDVTAHAASNGVSPPTAVLPGQTQGQGQGSAPRSRSRIRASISQKVHDRLRRDSHSATAGNLFAPSTTDNVSPATAFARARSTPITSQTAVFGPTVVPNSSGRLTLTASDRSRGLVTREDVDRFEAEMNTIFGGYLPVRAAAAAVTAGSLTAAATPDPQSFVSPSAATAVPRPRPEMVTIGTSPIRVLSMPVMPIAPGSGAPTDPRKASPAYLNGHGAPQSVESSHSKDPSALREARPAPANSLLGAIEAEGGVTSSPLPPSASSNNAVTAGSGGDSRSAPAEAVASEVPAKEGRVRSPLAVSTSQIAEVANRNLLLRTASMHSAAAMGGSQYGKFSPPVNNSVGTGPAAAAANAASGGPAARMHATVPAAASRRHTMAPGQMRSAMLKPAQGAANLTPVPAQPSTGTSVGLKSAPSSAKLKSTPSSLDLVATAMDSNSR
jgi:hypothetical protein